MMRPEVMQLAQLGPLPPESADEERIAVYERLLRAIDSERPMTDEEAKVLVGLFGPDECYGLAWTLVHLIETAPGWPLEECLRDSSNQWIRHLRNAAERATKLQKGTDSIPRP